MLLANSVPRLINDQGGGYQFQFRQILLLAGLFSLFSLIGGNLISLAVLKPDLLSINRAQPIGVKKIRPDILDAKGRLLATDIEAPSLYANPSGLMNPVRVVKKLKQALPEIDEMDLLRKMTHEKRQFIFIKRGMHPRRAQDIFDLGLPGVDVTNEIRRVYPKGALAGHILGHVDIDNVGRSGIEKYLDKQDDNKLFAENSAQAPVSLSLDISATHILNGELKRAIQLYKAKYAAGLVMNVNSGEVVAISSLPEFDPQKPSMLLDKKRFDRIAGGVFELGSVFKTLTMAMVLEENGVKPETQVEVSEPIKLDGHTIKDYHPFKGTLSLRDVFVRSSNIGTAKLALQMGVVRHRAFLKKMHLLDPIDTEIGTLRTPETRKNWSEVHSATASYGHGIAVTPLQFAASVASLVNGGIYIPPTFLKRSERDAKQVGERVVSLETSEQIRQLLRDTVVDENGTAKQADIGPYRVGGKTGTANKVVNGVYSKDKVRTNFVGIFPYDRPEYLVFVMLDEPQATKASHGLTVAAVNAAPTTGRIIERLAPLLKVKPFFPVLNRLTSVE